MSESQAQKDGEVLVPSEVSCPSCKHSNGAGSRYCSQCGVRLGTASFEDLEGPASKRVTGFGTLSEVRETADPDQPIADPLIGTTVAGRYRIIEPLGRGGMGVVYRVEHARIGKLMALKLLTGELGRDPEIVARFKREALMVSKLSHPNTVQVFDFGVAEGLTYLAMEYLRGDDLGHIVRHSGPLDPERCAKIIIQVCSSLGEAHGLGIVHRDLKPENLMVLGEPGTSGLIKVLDFGVSKSDWLEQAARLRLTGTADVLGTPTHMSPEQVRSSKSVDARTDIWALGVILYEALTGVPPFLAENLPALCAAIVSDEPRPPRELRPELPAALEAIILRCLEKHADARPFSVRSLAELLAPFAADAGGVAVDKIRGVAEASVPRISAPPPPPRLTPIPPAPIRVSTGPSPDVTDTASFRRQVSTRRRAIGAAAALLVSVGVAAAFLVTSLDDAVEASPSAAPATAPTRQSLESEALDDRRPQVLPAASADAGPPPRRRGRPAGNPLDTRF